jgi:hypothetical protein
MKKTALNDKELEVASVFLNFAVEADYVRHRFLNIGHINETFLVEARSRGGRERFIFQRINHNVFRDPERLMSNFERITRHIRAKLEQIPGGNPDRETLNLVGTRSGKCFHLSEDGDYWRAYRFVGECHVVEIAENPGQAYEAGRAFGRFQKLLADLPPSELHETIPFFHHTPRRFLRFQEALNKDLHARGAKARAAVDFALEREPMIAVVTEALEEGRLPLRITHNDTKINNVLFDDLTGKAICVIDLDTTMPGSPLYDFGDMVRTTTSFSAEDERNLSRVKMEMEMFRALASGYLEEALDFLTLEELDLLAFSGRLVTFTIGLRFLTDYLEGDAYFRTHRPGQNLDRAMVQFALVKSMEDQQDEMHKCVRAIRNKSGRSSSGHRS